MIFLKNNIDLIKMNKNRDIRKIENKAVSQIVKCTLTLNNEVKQATAFVMEDPKMGLKIVGPARLKEKLKKLYQVEN